MLRLLLIVVLWFIVSRLAEITHIVTTLLHGRWQWIVVAAGLQLTYYILFATVYHEALYTVGVKSTVRHLLPLLLSSLAVNVAAPSASTAGAMLFIDDAAQRGQSPAKAAAGALLQLITEFSAFTLIILVGFIYLFTHHSLYSYQIIGFAILLLLTGGLSSLFLVGLWWPRHLRHTLEWLQRLITLITGWINRASPLHPHWAAKNAIEFIEAALAITRRPSRLFTTFVIAVLTQLVNMTSLYALFLAFYQPLSIGQVTAGFAVGMLFGIVSPVPSGIGIVEAVMPLVYISLGIPGETATVVTLAWRGLGFWIPLALGFFFLPRLRSFKTSLLAG